MEMSKNGSGEKGHKAAAGQEMAILTREKWMDAMYVVELMSKDLWMDSNGGGMRKGRNRNG